jgi:hypothetical protein
MKFVWTILPRKENWGVCVGYSYNYWNTRGENYTGVHIYSIHIFTLNLRWYREDKINMKEVSESC